MDQCSNNDTDIFIVQGDTYSETFQLLDASRAPYDLSEWSVTSQLRNAKADVFPAATFDVTPSTNGYVALSLSPTTTQALSVGSYWHDIRLVHNSDSTTKYFLLGSKAFVKRVVTV